MGGCELDPNNLGEGPVADSCEYSNETSGYTYVGWLAGWLVS
jgi:hypothetical protein